MLRNHLKSKNGIRSLTEFPMALERHIICKPDAVPQGQGQAFTVNGMGVALFNVDGEFYALEDRCSHMNVPISNGYVHERELCVACPWHGAEFDLRTGKVMTPPACENINAYPVYVEEGNVVLEVENE